VCECESTNCTETVTLTVEEYEAVRSDPLVVRELGRGHDLAVEFDPGKHNGA
jgi:hypothetical protein